MGRPRRPSRRAAKQVAETSRFTNPQPAFESLNATEKGAHVNMIDEASALSQQGSRVFRRCQNLCHGAATNVLADTIGWEGSVGPRLKPRPGGGRMSLGERLTRAVGERGASQVSKDIFWRVERGASQALKDILWCISGYPVLVATVAERLSELRLPELLIRTTPIGMNHLSPARVAPMREIISRFANDRPINLLEIGTWFGAGSTALFLEILPRGSSITLVDSWRKYHPPEAQTTLAARSGTACRDQLYSSTDL